jgi:hypothetical protein
LPFLTRHLFLLVTLEGFSVERAAALLGMTQGEAGSLLARARKQAPDTLEMPTDMVASGPRAPRNHGSKSAAQTSWWAPLHQPATGEEAAAR